MVAVAFWASAILLPLFLYCFLKTQIPGEWMPGPLRLMAAAYVAMELAFAMFCVAIFPYWLALVLNLVLNGFVVAANRDRLRLHMGVLGLWSDGLPMYATPGQIRDFIGVVLRLYPHVKEATAVFGITTPAVTIEFDDKLCATIRVNTMTLEQFAALLYEVHPETQRGPQPATLRKYVYQRTPSGEAFLTSR